LTVHDAPAVGVDTLLMSSGIQGDEHAVKALDGA
jgi:hypothetical protein